MEPEANAKQDGVDDPTSGDESQLTPDPALAAPSQDDDLDDDPVLHGHPMNRRQKGIDGELDTGNPGSMSGTNRSVKVTNKSRKKPRA